MMGERFINSIAHTFANRPFGDRAANRVDGCLTRRTPSGLLHDETSSHLLLLSELRAGQKGERER